MLFLEVGVVFLVGMKCGRSIFIAEKYKSHLKPLVDFFASFSRILFVALL